MEKIFQQGTVSSVNGNDVTVTISCKSSCLHCRIKNNCAMADTRLKNITIHTQDASNFQLGQKVTLAMDERQGWLAVFLGYILPLILVLSVLLMVLTITADETSAAVWSLGSLLPYYFFLAVFRKKISHSFVFRIISE